MKIIKPTQAHLDKMIEKFKKEVLKARSTDGKVKFEESLTSLIDIPAQKREIIFSSDAYCKMRSLIMSTNDEIAWHGTVQPVEFGYIIKDIIMYPQTVTGVTVTTDDEEYAKWMMEQEDAIFDCLRMQGHSHVRMSCNPSGVDSAYYDSILQNLNNDDYYIFMIANKQGNLNVWIHELNNNLLFEPADIVVSIKSENGDSIDEWVKTQSEKYVTKFSNVKTTGFAHVPKKAVGSPLHMSDEDWNYYVHGTPRKGPKAKNNKGGKKK